MLTPNGAFYVNGLEAGLAWMHGWRPVGTLELTRFQMCLPVVWGFERRGGGLGEIRHAKGATGHGPDGTPL